MQKHVSDNDGYKYALMGYDTYSKYFITFALKNRKPDSIVDGLEFFEEALPFSIGNIYWDREGSFLSRVVQKWLKIYFSDAIFS